MILEESGEANVEETEEWEACLAVTVVVAAKSGESEESTDQSFWQTPTIAHPGHRHCSCVYQGGESCLLQMVEEAV